jgi:hypothetical protein
METTFKSVADVLNAFNVGIFPMKDKPGKFFVRVIGKDGKKMFVDRRAVAQTDGTTKWEWVMGREMTSRDAVGAQMQLPA